MLLPLAISSFNGDDGRLDSSFEVPVVVQKTDAAQHSGGTVQDIVAARRAGGNANAALYQLCPTA